MANDVARRLVIAPHRSGGQAQYVETPTGVAERDGVIAASMAWALDNLDLSARWCLIHCTQMTPAETVGLARTGAVAGLCPLTDVCPYYALAIKGKASMAPIPKGSAADDGPPRYHDELIHGWMPPERR